MKIKFYVLIFLSICLLTAGVPKISAESSRNNDLSENEPVPPITSPFDSSMQSSDAPSIGSRKNNDTFISIIYDDMEQNHIQKSFFDKTTISTVMNYFSALIPSPVEMTPKVGSAVITIKINENGKVTFYQLNSYAGNGPLYCKNISETNWILFTGWQIIPDSTAYDYILDMIFSS